MKLFTFLFVILILVSCESNNDSLQIGSNIYTVHVIDSITGQPINNAKLLLYYKSMYSSKYDPLTEQVSNAFIKNASFFPNPIYDKNGRIMFDTKQNCNIRIQINDLKTKSCLIKIVESDNVAIGTYEYFINTTNLVGISPGIYTISIYANDILSYINKFLYAPNHFVSYANYPIGEPYITLFTNSEGKAEINLDDFKNKNENIQKVDINGLECGYFKISYGCYIRLFINEILVSEMELAPKEQFYKDNSLFFYINQ